MTRPPSRHSVVRTFLAAPCSIVGFLVMTSCNDETLAAHAAQRIDGAMPAFSDHPAFATAGQIDVAGTTFKAPAAKALALAVIGVERAQAALRQNLAVVVTRLLLLRGAGAAAVTALIGDRSDTGDDGKTQKDLGDVVRISTRRGGAEAGQGQCSGENDGYETLGHGISFPPKPRIGRGVVW